MSKTLPVGIQVYGLRDFLENTPENFKNVRDKKAKLHKIIIKVLEAFKAEKYVKDYTEILDKKSVIGVEIEV